VGQRVGLDTVAKTKKSLPCQKSNFDCPPHSIVTVVTELLQFSKIR